MVFISPTSLSLFYLLFSFPLVSYTLLLLGESDGGLVPRHREEQDDLAGTAPYLKTCARDQSVDWRDCASASTVFKQATPSLVPKHLLLLEDDPAARSPPQTSFVYSVYILPVRPSVLPRSTAVLTRRNVVHEELDASTAKKRERERKRDTARPSI